MSPAAGTGRAVDTMDHLLATGMAAATAAVPATIRAAARLPPRTETKRGMEAKRIRRKRKFHGGPQIFPGLDKR